jgi:sugar (pentulose or hexulose) kinase
MEYFLAYDIGTSSVKAILVDSLGNILTSAIENYPLTNTKPRLGRTKSRRLLESSLSID